MSKTLLEFINSKQSPKWFKRYITEFFKNLTFKEIKKDDSWKVINLKSSYYPAKFPKLITDNSITLYMELNNQQQLWKRF